MNKFGVEPLRFDPELYVGVLRRWKAIHWCLNPVGWYNAQKLSPVICDDCGAKDLYHLPEGVVAVTYAREGARGVTASRNSRTASRDVQEGDTAETEPLYLYIISGFLSLLLSGVVGAVAAILLLMSDYGVTGASALGLAAALILWVISLFWLYSARVEMKSLMWAFGGIFLGTVVLSAGVIFYASFGGAPEAAETLLG